jgi:N-acetylmuramoyl-L-alanine amidase
MKCLFNSDRTILPMLVILTMAAIAPPSLSAAGCDKKTFKIVLDVGHTEIDQGATSARGVREYSFNLDLSRAISSKLIAEGFQETDLLITKGEDRPTLHSRAAHANQVKASLFLSIHHDSAQRFYLEKWVYNGTVQYFSDRFSGYSLFVSSENANKHQSLKFATLLADQLLSSGMTFTRHHAEAIPGENRRFLDEQRGIYQYDKLAVLRSAKAPAVLMEAGVIVNRLEESTAASPERRDLIANAVSSAVAQFCELQAQ